MRLFRIILSVVFVIATLRAQAQSDTPWITQAGLLGNTSLTYAPSAYIGQDREIRFGANYVPQTFASTELSVEGEEGEKVYFANLTFLPFLETTIRVTRTDNQGNEGGLGSRSLFLRLNVLRERKNLPSIVLGAHDTFGTDDFQSSTYIVAGKQLNFIPQVPLRVHLGYGTDKFFDAQDYYLLGLFGGVEANWKFLQAHLEYDADNINAGARAALLNNHLFLNLYFLDMSEVTGGLYLRFTL